MVLHGIIENIMKISKNKEKIGMKEVVTDEKTIRHLDLLVMYVFLQC